MFLWTCDSETGAIIACDMCIYGAEHYISVDLYGGVMAECLPEGALVADQTGQGPHFFIIWKSLIIISQMLVSVNYLQCYDHTYTHYFYKRD